MNMAHSGPPQRRWEEVVRQDVHTEPPPDPLTARRTIWICNCICTNIVSPQGGPKLSAWVAANGMPTLIAESKLCAHHTLPP